MCKDSSNHKRGSRIPFYESIKFLPTQVISRRSQEVASTDKYNRYSISAIYIGSEVPGDNHHIMY